MGGDRVIESYQGYRRTHSWSQQTWKAQKITAAPADTGGGAGAGGGVGWVIP